MNILWLYGSVTKWDAINHWYHLDFARILAKQLNINKIWMQPGSESDKAIEMCKQNNIKCTHNSCIMF